MEDRPQLSWGVSRTTEGGVRVIVIGVLAGWASGCVNPESACTLELGARYAPETQTLAVGSSFTAAVTLSTCGGRSHPSDRLAWASSDSSVVAVDAGSGRVTAR